MLAFVPRLLSRLTKLVIVLVLVFVVPGLVGRVAAAHVILVESAPPAGSTVGELADVRLTFAGEVAEDGHSVVLATADGREAPAAAVERRDPTTLVARFDAGGPPGDHQILWEVVALDGDRQRGSIPITVATGRAAAADPGEKVPPPPPAVPEAGTAEDETARAPASERAIGDDEPVGYVAVLVLALFLLLAAATLFYRRRSVRSASR